MTRICLYAFVLTLLLTSGLRAQNQADGTLHVLRPSINAEQDSAELCLEFDQELDLSDPARISAALHLESDGKSIPVTPPNISFAANLLCIQSLVHRQDYRLTITDLRGAKGEKLTEPYRLSFTIPDRHPSLAFAGEPGTAGLARYKDANPVLRAINVARVQVTLYRITDPAHMAEAYRQRMQTMLAPSESLTFAKNNGQLVWQGEIVLDDSKDNQSANQNIEHPLPLSALAGNLTPGLYFIAAAGEMPHLKTKLDEPGLVPLAAQWFIDSNLKIRAIRKDDGFYVETGTLNPLAIAKGVRVILFNRDQQILAEGKSDASGLAFLPLAPEKWGDAAVLAGLTQSGDVDLAGLSADGGIEPDSRFTMPNLEANLAADRPFYLPGANVHITLTAHNIHGDAVATPNSSLQLLRPDRSPFAVVPVADGKAGISYVSFPAPAANGAWPVVWRQSDGSLLAQGTLRVTSNKEAPVFTMAADRAALGDDGAVTLSLKSLTNGGKPLPYMAGHVMVQWTQPDSFAGWSDYHFGRGDQAAGIPAAAAAFITDAQGTAQLHITLKPPNDTAPFHAALVSIRPDPSQGALAPDPVSLPVRPGDYIVGIKPLASDAKFAENSLARFDVIAIDGDGKRRDVSGLKYQIYAEGRSFAWYPSDGHWEYKQLQQRRRIGGNVLNIKSAGSNIIRWPVTAGAYALEITNTNGALLARVHFDAGWGLLKPGPIRPGDLVLVPALSSARPGIPARIRFKLDRPALISVVIADDRIRKVMHELRAAGANEIEFTPAEDWGNHLRIRIEANEAADTGMPPLTGQIELPLRHQPKELEVTASLPSRLAGGQEIAFTVTVGKIAARQPTFVNVLATPLSTDDKADSAPASQLVQGVEAGAGGKALIHMTVPQISGSLHLVIVASNHNQWGQKELSVPVQNIFDANLEMPPVLQTGDVMRPAIELKNNQAAAGPYRYALNATRGLEILGAAAGKANFSAGGAKTLAFDLRALESGSNELKFDLSGPRNFHIDRTWPVAVAAANTGLHDIARAQIAPRQSWTPFAAGKNHGREKQETLALFLAAQPLFDTPEILTALAASEPFTTSEMAGWLEAMRLWGDMVAAANVLPASVLQTRQQNTLTRLLARQQPDGSFPALSDGAADFVSTADALVTLVRIGGPRTGPAVDAAAGWLRQQLSNTWFDEKERPVRAAGFAALAAADRLDVSALRYFAETSTGKSLPPLAMAQLAAALAKSNDQDKANTWLKSVHGQIASAPALWPVLAENPLFDPRDLTAALQSFSDMFVHHSSRDPASLTAYLRALWVVNDRAGNWQSSINGVDKERHGVFVMKTLPKPAPLTLRNPMDRPLYAVASAPVKMPPHAAAIQRHIYALDGNAVSGPLKRNQVYLIEIEGSWPAVKPGQDGKLFVSDRPGAVLRPLGCALDKDAIATDAWAWLKNMPLTPVLACRSGGNGIDAVIAIAGGDKGTWRIAYLAKTKYEGAFKLAPSSARIPGDDEWMTGIEQKIEIR